MYQLTALRNVPEVSINAKPIARVTHSSASLLTKEKTSPFTYASNVDFSNKQIP